MAQNGGKSNDTLYTGALAAQAKQLRSQYPGYRDYIDEQIKSISGVDPANAYMRNLTEDINHAQENSKTVTNSILSSLKDAADQGFHDAGGTNAATVHAAVVQGLITPEKALSWLNSAKSVDYDIKNKANLRLDRQGDDADVAVQATKDLANASYKSINQAWYTMTTGKGTDTFDGMVKFLQQNAGTGKVSDEQAMAMGQQMQAIRDRVATKLLFDAQSNGTVKQLGGDPSKAKSIIEASLATMDLAISSIKDKDWGAAYSHMNFNKAIGADTGYQFNNPPDVESRKYNRSVQWISQNGGSEFAKEFQTQMLLGPVPQSEAEWYKSMNVELLAQPGQAQGKLTSINSAIQKGKQASISAPQTYSELINRVGDINNPKASEAVRLNIANAFFDPKANAGLLSDNNFKTADKYSVFTKLTTPEVAQGIAKLGQSHPEVVQNYRDMLSREFGEQLFSRELQDLSKANQSFTPNSSYKFKFTDDSGTSPHFEIVGAHGEPITMTQAIALGAPVGSVNRLNTGMAGLYTAYKGSGSTDPTHDILTTISRYNYQDASNVNNSPKGYESLSDIPKAIWNSLLSARLQAVKQMQPYQSQPAGSEHWGVPTPRGNY